MFLAIFRNWAEYSRHGSIEYYQATCIQIERGLFVVLADTPTASGSIFYYPGQTLESITPLDKPEPDASRLEFNLVEEYEGDPAVHLVTYHPKLDVNLDIWIAEANYHLAPIFGPIQVGEIDS